jgi:hypothetical protein
VGVKSKGLYHSTFDGRAWSPDNVLAGRKARGTPALAAFNGALHMLYLGESRPNVYHSSFDGSTWSAESQIPGYDTNSSPTAGVFDGALHVTTIRKDTSDVYDVTYDGRAWGSATNVPGFPSHGAPAHYNDGKRLWLFASLGNKPMRYCAYDGRAWGGAYEISGQSSAGAPGVVPLADGPETVLHVIYREHDGTAIWHTRGFGKKAKG